MERRIDMGYYAVDDETEDLQHHGILGMKWGVRRFQRKDGTRTPAGKARERGDSDETQNDGPKRSINGKTVAKVALGAAAAVGAGALAYQYATMPKEYRALINSCAKVGIKDLGKNAADYTKKKLSTVGDRMVDAALLSIGGMTVASLTKKVNDKFADKEGDSEATKAFNKVARDTLTAGINEAINGKAGSNNATNKTWSDRTGTHAGKEITDKIGAPSNKNIDRSSKEWQDLFKDSNGNQRDADTRATIKSLANAGYDIDQIDKWLNHAEIEEWMSQYMATEIRW